MTLRQAWRRSPPPRSPQDAEFLSRYEMWSRPLLVAAALLPLIITNKEFGRLGVLVGVASWLVFVADYVVQVRRRERYTASRRGMFDLAIVVVTSPWYLLPGVHGGSIVVVLRLARLLRVLVLFKGAHRLFERLGRAALLAVAVVVIGAWLAFDAERSVNPMFASYGDSLWWAIVTLTTVGYGDIVPITVSGRITGTVIMVAGVALLGVLAGSLASFFRLTPAQEKEDEQRQQQDLADPGNAGNPTAARLSKQLHGKGSGDEDGSVERDEGDAEPPARADTGHPESAAADPEPIAPQPAAPTGPRTPPAEDAVAALTREVVDLRDQISQLSEHIRSLSDRRS